jgi:hypothetical protein
MYTTDRLYVGAPELAQRLFGNRDKKNVRRIYHWHEQRPPKRPPFLKEVNGQPAAFESGIRRFADADTDSGESAL